MFEGVLFIGVDQAVSTFFYHGSVAALIRPLDPAELESMLDLSARLYSDEGLRWDRATARRAAAELLAAPEQGGIWLIERDGQIAGYFVLTVCFSLEFGGRFGLLDELYTAELWRGRGLGTEALKFAASWCRSHGMEALRLEVWTGNAGAIRLYERAGFALEERHLMTQRLRPPA
jgi:GNAT superfamily N-acetyltransferase